MVGVAELFGPEVLTTVHKGGDVSIVSVWGGLVVDVVHGLADGNGITLQAGSKVLIIQRQQDKQLLVFVPAQGSFEEVAINQPSVDLGGLLDCWALMPKPTIMAKGFALVLAPEIVQISTPVTLRYSVTRMRLYINYRTTSFKAVDHEVYLGVSDML
jgi:hypothetical protein